MEFFYFTARGILVYLTNRNTKNAVIKKSIKVEITLPYKIPLKDKSSILLTFNFVKIGLSNIGVIKSSINPLTKVDTLVAISNHTAIPTILYCAKKWINSWNIVNTKKDKIIDTLYSFIQKSTDKKNLFHPMQWIYLQDHLQYTGNWLHYTRLFYLFTFSQWIFLLS